MWIIWGFSLTQDHKYSLENDFSFELMNIEDDETDEDEDDEEDKDDVNEHNPVLLLAVQENDETEEIELVE